MKIALVNSEFPSPSGADHGGIATYTVTLAHQLVRRGHIVHICTRSGIRDYDAHPGLRLHQFGFLKSSGIAARIIARLAPNPLSWERGQARALATLLSDIAGTDGLDLVEIPEYGGLARATHLRRRVPCVITFHTPAELVDLYNDITPQHSHRERYAFERTALKHADAYKSPSNALKQWVGNRYGIAGDSIGLIRNPFDPGPLRAISPGPVPSSSRFDILFSGRFERRKGAEMLLHSIRDILSIDKTITFTIAGETDTGNAPNYRQAIERILTPEERRRVWFPGPLSRQQLLPLYRNSSLFLFPSLFENSPYALIEAMAAGLPVVATEGSGIGEIITHQENGLLYPANDRIRLAASVGELFKNRERTAELGRNASKSIDVLFDEDKIVEAHVAHYETVIKKRQ